MKDAIRLILVDPNARSRQTLQAQLEDVGGVEVIEVCQSYQPAIRRISALVPDLALVTIDEDVDQAIELVETVTRSVPGVTLVPAGPSHDVATILRSMRAGAREFLPLPTTPDEIDEVLRRICP